MLKHFQNGDVWLVEAQARLNLVIRRLKGQNDSVAIAEAIDEATKRSE